MRRQPYTEKAKAYNKKWYADNREMALAGKKKWREENREKALARERKVYANRREKVLVYKKKCHAENPEKNWARQRLYKYGLTPEKYQQMLQTQGFACCLCKNPRKLCVDHCHTKGTVRGLLCRKCNTGLGCFQDSSKLLQDVIDYLTKPS